MKEPKYEPVVGDTDVDTIESIKHIGTEMVALGLISATIRTEWRYKNSDILYIDVTYPLTDPLARGDVRFPIVKECEPTSGNLDETTQESIRWVGTEMVALGLISATIRTIWGGQGGKHLDVDVRYPIKDPLKRSDVMCQITPHE